MVIREYGTENSKNLVFFQGSCEPWEEFRPAAEGLAKAFHVMLVTPDGHDPEEQNDFLSVEKTVDDTGRWLKEHSVKTSFTSRAGPELKGRHGKQASSRQVFK